MRKSLLVSFLLVISFYISRAQDNQGFFLDDWLPKNIVSPSYIDTTQSIGATQAVLNIDFADKIAKVSKYVYGNNGNPYSGRMNTDATLLKYINDLSPNVIRWPGGNLSQEYFWDRSTRPADMPTTVNFWGGKGSGQTNADFYDLLKKTNSTGSICVNIAYARYGTSETPVQTAAHYAANWVRFDKGRSKFWELGNENFGTWEAGYKIDTLLSKDHQPEIINGELYGKICRVFIDSMRAAAAEIGVDIKIGAVAMEQQITWDEVQKNWNPGMMAQLADKADFYIVHSYYTPYEENSPIATILNSPSHTREFVDFINAGLAAVGHGPMPIALTEWNIFAIKSMQMVSYVNGMQTAINVGELIKNKFGMANKWNLSNGWGGTGDDHGMFAASDEPGVTARTPHPQFHYMYYFQKCFGDQMVNAVVTGNANVLGYASSFTSGQCGVVLANKSRVEQNVEIKIKNFELGKHYYIYTLTGGTDNGDFSRKVYINGQGTTGVAGGPANYAAIKPYGIATDDKIKIAMPPLSVIYTIIDSKNIPDIKWASVSDDPNSVKVKLTNAVVIPDTVEGFKITLNDSQADSITKVERDLNDSTTLILTLNKPVVNTDKVLVSYNAGNLKAWNNISLVETSGFEVENLLKGSSPLILDIRTDNSGSAIYVHFNKKMNAAASASFKANIYNLDKKEIALSAVTFYNGDSSTYSLKFEEPLYFDYNLRLSSVADLFSSDGGKLATINSLIVKNYSPYKPSTIQQAYTSSKGDSIYLIFDKNLLVSSTLKNYFKVSLDGIDVQLKSVVVYSKAPNKLIIRPQISIDKDVAKITVSYSGTVLFSNDSAAVTLFSDQLVENLSKVTGLKSLGTPAFQIYPNPVKNLLTINSKFKYSKIEIVDITGKQVYINTNSQGFSETYSIPLQLSKGMYIITLSGKNKKDMLSKFSVD